METSSCPDRITATSFTSTTLTKEDSSCEGLNSSAEVIGTTRINWLFSPSAEVYKHSPKSEINIYKNVIYQLFIVNKLERN